VSDKYFVTYRVRVNEVRRDGGESKGEWAIHNTALASHPVFELLRWKKDFRYHCLNKPKAADKSWLENEYQLLWWTEIPEEAYTVAHEYEDKEGGL
jgi:hypothetical protein